MAFGAAINRLAGPAMGAPPPGGPMPPKAMPEAEAPAYDVAHDPGWKGLIDPHNHPLRNLFNQLTPEEREILRSWKTGTPQPGGHPAITGAAPPPVAGVPPAGILGAAAPNPPNQ